MKRDGTLETVADSGDSAGSQAFGVRAPRTAPDSLQNFFPFPGPWGRELLEAKHGVAREIANEPGLVWKLWLEDRGTGHAGGIYLFEDAASAERYREKHKRRLSAMGITGVTVNASSVHTELSVLTMAGAALGRIPASKSTSMATAGASS